MAEQYTNITSSLLSTQPNPGNIILTNYLQKSNEYYLPVVLPQRSTLASLSADVILWLVELRHRGESSDSTFEELIVLTDVEDVSYTSEEDNREVDSDLSCNSELLDEYLQLENSKPEDEFCETSCINFYQQVDDNVDVDESEQSSVNLDSHRTKKLCTSKHYEDEFDIWEELKIPKVNVDSSSSLCGEAEAPEEELNHLSPPEMSADKKESAKVSQDESCSSKQEQTSINSIASNSRGVTNALTPFNADRDKLADLKCDDILNNLDEMIKKFEEIQEKAAAPEGNVSDVRVWNLSLKDNEFVEMCETADFIIEETLKCHLDAASKVEGGGTSSYNDSKKPKIALKPNFLQESGFGSNSSDLSDDVFINSSEEKRDFSPRNINEIFDNGSNLDGQPPSAPRRKAKKKDLSNTVEERIKQCTKEGGAGADLKVFSGNEPNESDKTKETVKESTRDIFKTLPKELPKELSIPVALSRRLPIEPPSVTPRQPLTETILNSVNVGCKEQYAESIRQEPNSNLSETKFKESSKEVVPTQQTETIIDLIENAPKELPKDVMHVVALKQPNSPIANLIEREPKKLPLMAPIVMPRKQFSNIIEKEFQESTKEVVPKHPSEPIESLPERVPKDLPKEVAPALVPRQPKEFTPKLIEKIPKEVVPKHPSEPIESLPERVPKELTDVAPGLVPKYQNEIISNVEELPKELAKEVVPILAPRQPARGLISNLPNMLNRELPKDVPPKVFPRQLTKELLQKKLPRELPRDEAVEMAPRQTSKVHIPTQLPKDAPNKMAEEQPSESVKEPPEKLLDNIHKEEVSRELPRDAILNVSPKQSSIFSKVTSKVLSKDAPKEISHGKEPPKIMHNESHKAPSKDMPKQLPRYQNDSFNLMSTTENKINNVEDTCCLTSIKYDSEFVTPYCTPNKGPLDLKIHLTPTRPISSTTFPPNLLEDNKRDTKPICHHLSLRETSPKRPKSIVDNDNMARSQSSNDLVTKRSASLKWLPKSPRSSLSKLLEPITTSTGNLPETTQSRSQVLNEEKYDEILERLRKGSNASDITAWKQTLNTVSRYYHDDEMDPTAMQSHEWFSSNDLDKCGLSCDDSVDSDTVSLISTSQTDMEMEQLQKLSVANITSLIEAELRGKQNGPYRITKARSMLSTTTKFFGDDKMESAISLEQWCENMVILIESMLCRTKITENGKKVRKNWVSSYVVLTKTHILFFKDVKTFHAMKINPETFRPELCLYLAGGYIERDEKISRRKNKFTLSTMDGCQMILQSPSSTLIEQWYSLLEGAISKLPGHNMCPIIKKPKSKEQSPSSTGNNEEETFKLPRFVLNKDESMEDLTASAEERQTKTKARLKKFFNRRPTKESLVKKGIYKDEPMFGRDLCDIAVCQSATSPCIPVFVIQCIQAIEYKDENMKTDGLYRASGNLSQVQKIRLQVDQNSLSCLDEEEDVHVLTGVLKLFFRELKKPLIPFHLFNKAIEASSIRSHKERVKKLQDIINALPAPNHDTLEYLLQHLIRVTKNMEFNRMHIPNIAIVFGPTLMWPEEESLNMALDLMKQNQVVEYLLTDYEEIFQ